MPKAYPDFEEKAERFLDGELSPSDEKKFLGAVRKEQYLSQKLGEMKFARQAMKVYRTVLPSADEFNMSRRKILSALS
ncbi:MAG: hypothetical protein GF310_07760 [candidate division Zixibacteria bacterium]|nr:hypothetical protein [candidate division Zixibacteria bacterium]